MKTFTIASSISVPRGVEQNSARPVYVKYCWENLEEKWINRNKFRGRGSENSIVMMSFLPQVDIYCSVQCLSESPQGIL